MYVQNMCLYMICMCVYVGGHGYVVVHVWRSQYILEAVPWLPPCLKQGIFVVYCCVHQASWATSCWGVPDSASCLAVGAGSKDECYCSQLHTGCGWNACVSSEGFPTEPFPSPTNIQGRSWQHCHSRHLEPVQTLTAM